MSNESLQNNSRNVSEKISTREIDLVIVESCIFIILDLAALAGNVMVCLALYRNAALRKVPNYFVLSLALTDLAIAVFVIPLSASSSIANRWVFGTVGCQIRYFCAHSMSAISLVTLMLLAINRCFVVTRPVLYRGIYSKKRAFLMILASWLVPITVVLVFYFAAGLHFQPLVKQPADCFLYSRDANGLAAARIVRILWISVPSLVVLICYLKIFRAIRQHNRAVASSLRLGYSSFGVDEAKMTRTLTAVVVGFYISWSPVLFSIFLEKLNAISETTFKYYNFYFSFPYFISSVINPVIYTIMSRPFRKEFLKILHFQY